MEVVLVAISKSAAGQHSPGRVSLHRLLGTLAAAGLSPAIAAAETPAAQTAQPSLFSGDFGNVLVTLFIFSLLLLVLGKLGWKPLLTVLQQREQTIRDSLERAKREREQAAQLVAEHTAQMDQAREQAARIIEQGKRDAEEARRRIHEEARQQAEQMIAQGRREIQLATDAALKELYDRTADLTVQAASAVIRKKLSPDDHRRLVAESLEQMQSSGESKLN